MKFDVDAKIDDAGENVVVVEVTLLSQTAARPIGVDVVSDGIFVGFGDVIGSGRGLAPGTPIDVGRSCRHFTVTCGNNDVKIGFSLLSVSVTRMAELLVQYLAI